MKGSMDDDQEVAEMATDSPTQLLVGERDVVFRFCIAQSRLPTGYLDLAATSTGRLLLRGADSAE
ncbi:MAG: hypothetical protein NVS4B3_25580 [Gemmatimonadaceae bacterium]